MLWVTYGGICTDTRHTGSFLEAVGNGAAASNTGAGWMARLFLCNGHGWVSGGATMMGEKIGVRLVFAVGCRSRGVVAELIRDEKAEEVTAAQTRVLMPPKGHMSHE